MIYNFSIQAKCFLLYIKKCLEICGRYFKLKLIGEVCLLMNRYERNSGMIFPFLNTSHRTYKILRDC